MGSQPSDALLFYKPIVAGVVTRSHVLCGLASGCGLQRASLELPWFSLVLRQSVLLWLLSAALCTLVPLQWWEVDRSRL